MFSSILHLLLFLAAKAVIFLFTQADNEAAYGLFFYDKTFAITPKNSQQKFVKAASQCSHWSPTTAGPPLSLLAGLCPQARGVIAFLFCSKG